MQTQKYNAKFLFNPLHQVAQMHTYSFPRRSSYLLLDRDLDWERLLEWFWGERERPWSLERDLSLGLLSLDLDLSFGERS